VQVCSSSDSSIETLIIRTGFRNFCAADSNPGAGKWQFDTYIDNQIFQQEREYDKSLIAGKSRINVFSDCPFSALSDAASGSSFCRRNDIGMLINWRYQTWGFIPQTPRKTLDKFRDLHRPSHPKSPHCPQLYRCDHNKSPNSLRNPPE
jgi:hypothetical protein